MSQFEFTKMYCQFFPKGDPTDFSKFLFKNFDENGDGSIEFTEFLSAISMTSRGSIEQKLECKDCQIQPDLESTSIGAFKLYDIDGDGAITKEEMLQIVRAMFSMFGEDAIKNLEENTPEKRVEKIFALVDTVRSNTNLKSFYNKISGWKRRPVKRGIHPRSQIRLCDRQRTFFVRRNHLTYEIVILSLFTDKKLLKIMTF
jgi:Ca2+-binding EF-hand superfamily protein